MTAEKCMDTIAKYAMKNREVSITDITSLREHLGMDDFQIMQLFFDLESQGMKVDYRNMEQIDTVGELFDKTINIC